jgi:hypothetical protein
MNTPIVMCAVCNKQVDRIEWEDNYDNGQRVITAYCHGQRDTMTIDLRELTLELSKKLQAATGIAFQGPAVPRYLSDAESDGGEHD